MHLMMTTLVAPSSDIRQVRLMAVARMSLKMEQVLWEGVVVFVVVE